MYCRGLPFRDEDEAYDYFVQREIDERMDGLAYNDELHEYRLDGNVVPSVTQVLEPVRLETGGSDAQREYKRQIGKALDAAIQLSERQDLDYSTLSPEVLPYFEAWLAFKRDTGFRPLLLQPKVYSRKLRFAGTLDLLGTRVPDSLNPDELIDTKCTWAMDQVTALQTAGYAIAALESLGIRTKKRAGLQLLRDGKYKYHPFNDPNDEHVFKACLSIHAWRRMHK